MSNKKKAEGNQSALALLGSLQKFELHNTKIAPAMLRGIAHTLELLENDRDSSVAVDNAAILQIVAMIQGIRGNTEVLEKLLNVETAIGNLQRKIASSAKTSITFGENLAPPKK